MDNYKKINVLKHGFVRLVDYMGSDGAIVEAARVSYGKGTKTVSQDRALIRYLVRHKHTSPLEMCEIKFHIKVPIDVWRQWIRHRTASVNEYSTRYSIAIDENEYTNSDEWRLQSKDNKQGSDGFLEKNIGEILTEKERQLHILTKNIYKQRLELGLAREQARKDLLLSNYTEAYWKIDLHNLLHFLKLRLDYHAQFEIRQYANAIVEIIKDLFPLTWEAFEDYELNSLKFSKDELNIIKNIIDINLINSTDLQNLSNNEIIEFKNKLNKIKDL